MLARSPFADRSIGLRSIGFLSVALGLAAISFAVGFGWLGAYAAIPASLLWWLAARPGPSEAGGERGAIGAAPILTVQALLLVGLAISGFESNDLHRYLWEGGIQLHGFSPYATPPDAAVLEPLRDARFERVAFRELPSLYPPLAQWSFLAAAASGIGETGYRNGIMLVCLALAFVIARWLRHTDRPAHHLVFFAWSPVVVVSSVGGHVDVLMAAALVGFSWAWEAGRLRTAAALLGAAILAKTMAVLLLPWLLMRRPRLALLVTLPIVALGYAPYLAAGNVLGSLLTFAGDFRFNATLYEALHAVVGSGSSLAAGFLLVLWVGWCALRDREPADMAVRVLGGLLLLAPVVHYWYATWLLALLPGVRSERLRIAVLAFSAALAFLVPAYLAIAEGTESPAAWPFAAVQLGLPLAALLAHRAHRARRARRGDQEPAAVGIGVRHA